ncbi:MAG TPA: MFS transporter [Polyangia bacterium]|nr:MFS transporter [Polyangia bacterium]
MAASLRARLRSFIRVKDEEYAALLWGGAYYFCLLASYYVLRPLRETVGVAGGVKNLPYLFLGTLAGTLALNPLLSWLVSRFPRRRFVPWVYHFFAAHILIFYALMRGFELGKDPFLARVFFVWTSVFNLFVVSVFWGFMADLFRQEQGKRLFGFIGLGGTLGAMAGAAATEHLSRLGPVHLLLLSAALLEVAVVCISRLVRLFRVDAVAPGTPATKGAQGGTGKNVLDGVTRVLGSPYLLGICLFMLLYTLTSTFLYFEQARLVASLKGDAARTGMFARIDFYVNVVTMLCQVLITGRLLERLGVGPTLVALPVITLLGFVGLAVVPGLGLLLAFQVLRRGMDYGVTRPAREVLFTVLAREDKYQAKSFIDTFVYRGGDALAAAVYNLLAAGGMSVLTLVTLPLCILWAVVSLLLGRRQAQLATHAAPPAAPSGVPAG